jgi:hypothetical protein
LGALRISIIFMGAESRVENTQEAKQRRTQEVISSLIYLRGGRKFRLRGVRWKPKVGHRRLDQRKRRQQFAQANPNPDARLATTATLPFSF